MSLLQLYPEPSLPPRERGFVVERVDIVAVHGPTSNCGPVGHAALKAFTRVTADGQEVNWLQDARFLPHTIPHSQILLYCYDAPGLFATFSRKKLQHQSKSLLRVLTESRKDDPRRPIIFLSHSLGGLLIKQALRSAAGDPLYAAIKDAAQGIVFFGTPHRGITYEGTTKEASLESTVTAVLRKLFYRSKRENRHLPRPELSTSLSKQLDSKSQRDLNLAVLPGFPNIQVVSFYETIGSVVSRWQATLRHPREVVTPLQANHRNLCRFTSVEDESFLIARDTLQSLVGRVLSSNTGHRDLDYSGALLLHRLSLASIASTAPENLTSSSLSDTYHWILAHPSFQRWVSVRKNSVLWIEGKPGVGKTTLLTKVLEALRGSSSLINSGLLGDGENNANAPDDRRPIVAFFFCTYLEQPDSAVPILSSLLHQVFAARPSLSKYIAPDDKLECVQETTGASFLGSLLAAAAEFHTIYIVIDGLDECQAPVQKDLVDALWPRAKDAASKVPSYELNNSPQTSFYKVLFTSRLGSCIQRRRYEQDAIIDLSEGEAAEAVALNVRQFVRSELATNVRRLRLEGQEGTFLEDSILSHTGGLFLWAQLILDYLRGVSRDAGDVSSALSSLPRDLNSMYERIFERLQREEQKMERGGILLLRWIMFVKRSLSPSEAGEAIRVELGIPKKKNFIRQIMLGSWAGNFIRTDGDAVRFIHQSVHEFLSAQLEPGSPKVDGRLADNGRDVAVTTLAYLVQDFGHLHALPLEDRRSLSRAITKLTTIETLLQRFPLLEYASLHWMHHVNDLTLRRSHRWDLETRGLMRRLLDPKSAYFQIWFPIFWLHHCKETWERERYPMHPTELIVLAFLGIGRDVQWHLETNIENVDEPTPAGAEWTPLMAAAWMGHEPIVDILLDFDAGAKSHMRHNFQALVDSIERGHITIARKLMRHFASLQTLITSQRSILDSSLGQEMDRVLVSCIYSGSTELVYILGLEFGHLLGLRASAHCERGPHLDPIAKTLHYDRELAFPSSSLDAVVSISSLPMMNALIDIGTDISSWNWGFAAAKAENISLIRLILEAGADIHARDPYSGATPLQLAAYSGSLAIVKELLSHGADVLLSDHFGHSATEIAIRENSTAVWKLLDDSVKPSLTKTSTENVRFTTLRLAIQSAQHDIIGIVLDELPPSKWRMPVSSYVFDMFKSPEIESPFRTHHSDEHVATLTLLFKRGLDPYVKDERQNTLLHHSVRRQWPQLVISCLQNMTRGIEHRNELGETALDIAARLGDSSICELLVKHGAQVVPDTYRNSLSSGNPDTIAYVRQVRRDQSCVYQQRSEPAPLDAQKHSRPRDYLNERCPIHPMDFIDGKLQKAAEFLVLRQVDDLAKVELTTHNHFPYINKFKSWLEDTTHTPWIWWPLSPRMHALKPGEVRLHWMARGGSYQQQNISSELAQDIEQLLDCRDAIIASEPDDECDNFLVKPTHHLSSLEDITEGVCEHPYHVRASGSNIGTMPIGNRKPSWRRFLSYLCYLFSHILSLMFGAPVDGSSSVPTNASSGFQQGRATTNSQPPRASNSPSSHSPSGSRKRSRKNRGPRRRMHPINPVPPHGSYVIFKCGEKLHHIDAAIHNTDCLIFAELKRVYLHEKWALVNWLSIWRYHHCNFDMFKRSRSNLWTAKSTGSCTSNYMPVGRYWDDYHDPPPSASRQQNRNGQTDNTYDAGEGHTCVAPIDQRQFRALFYACIKRCSTLSCTFHNCKGPDEIRSSSSPNGQPSRSDGLLRPIPRRKEKWSIREDFLGYAWGLTAFDLPSFAGVLTYMALSIAICAVFWGLWLSIWNHEADLQNAAVPIGLVLVLWTFLWHWANGKWNVDMEIE